ncbi:hypothetical protein CXG50_24685 [Pseudomonas plecoglossicida]|nr:hypothetical protein CX682_03185 [Pseudomonas sp. FFUP_PS_41]PLU97134.1 hypothetical protein CXG52_15755 [Pseudomonas plecoglossicida]PLV03750.1 hypothetical protein CXG50_24685 [Pseudomonas plecoglossicida]
MSPDPNAQGGTNLDMPTSPDLAVDPDRPTIPAPDDDPLMNEEEGADWQEEDSLADDGRQSVEQPAVDLDQRRE